MKRNIPAYGGLQSADPPGGIEFTFSFSETENEERRPRRDHGVRQLVILILGVYGILTVFTSSFRLEYNPVLLYVCPLLFSAAAFGAVRYRGKKRILLLPAAVLWAAAGFLFRQKLYAGLLVVVNGCLKAASESKGLAFTALGGTVPGNPGLYTAATLCYFMLPVTFLLAYAVLYRPNVFLSLLFALPVLEAAMYYGLMPSLVPMGALMAFLLGSVSIQRSSDRPAKAVNRTVHDERSGFLLRHTAGSMGLAVAFVFGFLMIAFGLLMPAKTYTDMISGSPVLKQLGNLTEKDFWMQLFQEDKSKVHGGITGGKVGDVSEYVFTGETDLVLTSDSFRNPVYLRGYVGTNFENGSWTGLPDDTASAYKKAVSQAGMEPWKLCETVLDLNGKLLSPVFQANLRELSVSNVGAPEAYAYVPYNAEYGGSLKLNADGTAKLTGKSYSTTYYDLNDYDNSVFLLSGAAIKSKLAGSLGNGGGSVTADEIDACFTAESAYAAWVHESYTALPEDLPAELTADFGGLDNSDVAALIKTVTVRLADMVTYTLKPGKLPEGKNYLEYVLYENKKGYSTDFATAATVIFRMNGVPARYVEGYVATVDDYTNAQLKNGKYQVSLKDTNSHAWVEVYLDGFGWVPVEVTPGFTALRSDQQEVSGKTADYEARTGEATNDITVRNPAVGQDTDSPSAGTAPSQDKAAEQGGGLGILLWVLVAVLALAAAVSLTLLRRKLVLRAKEKRYHTGSPGACALAAYAQITALIGYAGLNRSAFLSELSFSLEAEDKVPALAGRFAEAARLALKAAFSRAGLSEEERDAVIGLERALALNLYESCPPPKKLIFKYILAYI